MKKRVIKITIIIVAIIAVISLIKLWQYMRPQKFEGTMVMYNVECEDPDEAAQYQVTYSLVMKRFLPEKYKDTVEFTGTVKINDKEYVVGDTTELPLHYWIELIELSDDYEKFPEVKVDMMIMRDFSFMAIRHVGSDEYCKGPAESYEAAKNLTSPLFDE